MYVHMQGVAVRDLKLENILLDRTNSMRPLLKICDFGYSKVTGQQPLPCKHDTVYLVLCLAAASGHGQALSGMLTDLAWAFCQYHARNNRHAHRCLFLTAARRELGCKDTCRNAGVHGT